MFLTPGQYKHWLWMVYIQINLFYFQERYCLVTIASLHIDFFNYANDKQIFARCYPVESKDR